MYFEVFAQSGNWDCITLWRIPLLFFWFKTNNEIKGYYLILMLWKTKPTWSTGGVWSENENSQTACCESQL